MGYATLAQPSATSSMFTPFDTGRARSSLKDRSLRCDDTMLFFVRCLQAVQHATTECADYKSTLKCWFGLPKSSFGEHKLTKDHSIQENQHIASDDHTCCVWLALMASMASCGYRTSTKNERNRSMCDHCGEHSRFSGHVGNSISAK